MKIQSNLFQACKLCFCQNSLYIQRPEKRERERERERETRRRVSRGKITWTDHVDYVCSKAAQRIGLLHRIRKRLPALAIRSVYLTSVRPVLAYAQLARCGLSAQDINHLERLGVSVGFCFNFSGALKLLSLSMRGRLAREPIYS